jgi:hypothetical protein
MHLVQVPWKHPAKKPERLNDPSIPNCSDFLQDLVFSLSLPAQPRLSGFLRIKKSRNSLLIAWKERWFVLIPTPSCVVIQYYRRKGDLLSTSIKRVCISAGERASPEPKLGSYGEHCFSFVSTSGERIFLAASSEFQRSLWISCINSMSQETAGLRA